MCLVGFVGPEAVIAGGNGYAAKAHEKYENGPFVKVVAIKIPVEGYQDYGECRR